jgi:hypothetical protein
VAEYLATVAGVAHIELEAITAVRQGILKRLGGILCGKGRAGPLDSQVAHRPYATMAEQQRTRVKRTHHSGSETQIHVEAKLLVPMINGYE